MPDRAPSKLLILAVDRDDDIGRKAKISTPVIGRQLCIGAGSELSLADPEEADANTIFAAVKELDHVVSKGYEAQVAIVSGRFERGFTADAKIREDLNKILEKYHADGIIFVSDGADDAEVIPILQGVIPVVSVKRVVVKHSKSVEESYAVIGRYLRMVIFDPRYSKLFLGVPGIILLVLGLMSLLGLLREAGIVVLMILGGTLLLRGFDLDHVLSGITRIVSPASYFRIFTIVTMILIVTAGFFQAYSMIANTAEFAEVAQNNDLFVQYAPLLIGSFVESALLLTWIGLEVYFGGALLFHYFRGSVRTLRNMVAMAALAFMFFPIREFALILQNPGRSPVTIVSGLLIGLLLTFIIAAISYDYVRKRPRRKSKVAV